MFFRFNRTSLRQQNESMRINRNFWISQHLSMEDAHYLRQFKDWLEQEQIKSQIDLKRPMNMNAEHKFTL